MWVKIRASPAERAEWHAKAGAAGLTLSDLVRRSIGRVHSWTVALEVVAHLVPDQQPVRFDVTFPARRPVPAQPMLPLSWVERLIRQKSLHDTPELVEILAALSATLEILLESLRGKQAHWNQPCRALRSSKLVYSVSPSPVRACPNAAMVSALGTFTANGKP